MSEKLSKLCPTLPEDAIFPLLFPPPEYTVEAPVPKGLASGVNGFLEEVTLSIVVGLKFNPT